MKHAALILLMALTALPARAANLRDHEGVNNGLIIAGIVEEIYKTCPTLDVRAIRGYFFLRSLYNMAEDAGFTEEEIKAYVDDKDQEERLRAIANNWLTTRGATEDDPETYCAIGRAEMANDTQIGSFLKED